MNRETLEQLFEQKRNEREVGSVSELFSSMLPTGDGIIEKTMNTIGVQEYWSELKNSVDWSAPWVSYAIYAVIAIAIWFYLRHRRIRTIQKQKKKHQ